MYISAPHECSYLPGREATTLNVLAPAGLPRDVYSRLVALGFRRSGDSIYRPHCAGCRACVPVRIPVARFEPNRNQRRCLGRNADLSVEATEARFTRGLYALYARYIERRHRDGGMYPPTPAQYRGFLYSAWSGTEFLEVRLGRALLAVAVVDPVADGLSAVYSFYDPAEEPRSLGRFAVLGVIREAARRGLAYVYLGFWIKECRKMSYKDEYRPIEYFDGWRWAAEEPERGARLREGAERPRGG